MTDLNIYNTLTRKKEKFESIVPGFVGMYVCGPTVYDHAHIGHAKSYISFDIIVRYLRYLGYKVRYVQNITDVGHLESDADEGEDKLQKQARLEKIEPMEVAETYTRSYFEDMDKLGLIRPDISPRASGHITEQIEMIDTLIKKEFAYEVNGNVYFDVSKFNEYGKLSGRKVDELEAGARVNINDEKKKPVDFALWKKADESHIMKWNSPWGVGYPGWHIECSCMSNKYIGETIDIHGGGLENIFPHHECEIAQSEAANEKPFVRYWIHNNMVTVDGVKMGKSLGNSIGLKSAFQKYSPVTLRYFILTSHYRSKLDFSDEALSAADKGLQRLVSSLERMDRYINQYSVENSKTKLPIKKYLSDFEAVMNDDFNTPQAIAALFNFLKEINSELDKSQNTSDSKEVEAALKSIQITAGKVLGIIEKQPGNKNDEEIINKIMDVLLEVRSKLRSDKNFEMSDFIRDQLKDRGVQIKDTASGMEWEFLN
ncbi:MAG: cysteine--tRNA ligase [Calditrichia bacterium]|nr:cysteine--tRNA ligase [Calditrichia bacterium]